MRHDRIFRGAAVLTVVAALAIVPVRGVAAGGGLALGGLLAMLNYAWLRSGVNALVCAAAAHAMTRPMQRAIFRFLLRIAVLGACLYAILISHLVPLAPVLGGLFVVPAAAVIEGVRLSSASRAPDVS